MNLDRWNTLKSYVDLGEEDIQILLSVRDMVPEFLLEVVEHFYQTALSEPQTKSILANAKVVQRLKGTMAQWVLDLFSGEYNEKYFQQQMRIGIVHLRIGLPNVFVFTAVNQLRAKLIEGFSLRLELEKILPLLSSLNKILDLSLATISESYLLAHETSALLEQQQIILTQMPLMIMTIDYDYQIVASTIAFQREFSSKKGHFIDAFPKGFLEASQLPQMLLETDHSGSLLRRSFLFSSKNYRITVSKVQHQTMQHIILLENITEEIQQQRKQSHIENLAQIGQMATTLAHEIRNPIAGISSSLQILESVIDPHFQEIIHHMQGKLMGMERLITDLLSFSRPFQYHLQSVPLDPLLESLDTDISVPITIDGFNITTVWCDPDRIQQVLLNLFRNATEAMQELEHPKLLLKMEHDRIIYVVDNGPNIPEKEREQLFAPFFTTKVHGTGLGLSISRKLMVGMGGNLEYCPNWNHKDHPEFTGACFKITLPHLPTSQIFEGDTEG